MRWSERDAQLCLLKRLPACNVEGTLEKGLVRDPLSLPVPTSAISEVTSVRHALQRHH